MLESFIAAAGLKASIERSGDPETEPDFIITLNNERVGIELTELFRDRMVDKNSEMESPGDGRKKISPSKKAEAIDRKKLADLSRSYYELCSTPITVDFISPLPCSREENKRTIEELIDIANKSKENQGKERRELGDAIVAYVRRLPKGLPARCARRWTYVKNHIGWTKKITHEMLDDVIRPKLGKLEKYKSGIEKVLLLIHADKTCCSGILSFAKNGPAVSANGFEAIYLYLHPQEAVRLRFV